VRADGSMTFGEEAVLPGTDSFSLPGGAVATFAIVVTLLMIYARARASVRASSSFKFRRFPAILDKISCAPIGKTPSSSTFCDLRHDRRGMLRCNIHPSAHSRRGA
jgi:hypothetical protein